MTATIQHNPASPSLAWKEFAVHALVMTALLVVAFPGVFVRGQLISSADILFAVPPWNAVAPEGFDRPKNVLKLDPLMAFRPDYRLVEQELAAGQWPLWNPLEYTGVPLLANTQSAALNPLYLLRAWFDVDTAMTVFVLLKLWLCGATAYLCARLIGLGIGASRFLSAMWMVGSYNLIWASWPLPDVSAWLPVVLLGVELLLSGKRQRGFFALALGATLILFAGHPETAFTMSLGVGLYLGFRLLWERRSRSQLWQPVAIAGAAWYLALAVYMIQLLPFGEYILHSYTHFARAAGQGELNAMEPGALIGFWIPRFYGTVAEGTFWDVSKVNSNLVSGQYLGLAVWAGLSLGFAGSIGKRMTPVWRARLIGLGAVSTAGILLAYEFPAVAFVNRLPVFDSIHPIYQSCFAYFALPLASAIGLEQWFSRPRRLTELWPVFGLLAMVSLYVGAVLWWQYDYLALSGNLEYIFRQVRAAAIVAAVAVALLSLSCVWRRPQILWALITIFLVADHLFACRGLNSLMARNAIFPQTELTRFLEAQPEPCRVGVAEAYIVSGGMSNYGIEEWLGYDGLYPERILRYQKTLGYSTWKVMEPINAIRFYVHDPTQDPVFPLNELLREGSLKHVATCDGLEVYENLGAKPRCFLVGALETIPDVNELFERMLDPTYRPDRTAITEIAVPGPIPSIPSSDVGVARILEYSPSRVRVAVEARQPAVLVLADAFYPGWHAALDGVPLDLFPVYYAFRGAVVPAGEHTVTYTYEPLTLRIGFWISFAALVASAAVSIFVLVRRGPS